MNGQMAGTVDGQAKKRTFSSKWKMTQGMVAKGKMR